NSFRIADVIHLVRNPRSSPQDCSISRLICNLCGRSEMSVTVEVLLHLIPQPSAEIQLRGGAPVGLNESSKFQLVDIHDRIASRPAERDGMTCQIVAKTGESKDTQIIRFRTTVLLALGEVRSELQIDRRPHCPANRVSEIVISIAASGSVLRA